MKLRIKNWAKFQHFKDRRPPWIKLYRDILDDPDWFALDGDSAKTLVMLWLIASEDDGFLPDTKKLVFRLRTTEQEVIRIVDNLSPWLEEVDSRDDKTISPRYQDDAPEKRQRRDREREEVAKVAFDRFWEAYPRKDSKAASLKAFSKIAPDEQLFAQILAGIERAETSEQWCKDDGKFIPHASTWLNQRRWEDEGTQMNGHINGSDSIFG